MKLCIIQCYPKLSHVFHEIMEFCVTTNIVKHLAISQAILPLCCEDDYFSKGKFKLFNSLFHSMYLFFPISLFSIADFFAVRYLWVICNEDKCCVVTQGAADIRVAWLVYVRTYCVPIATLNQNKRTRLLYLGDSQIKKVVIKGIADIMQRFCQSVSSGMHGNAMGLGPDLKI